MNLLKSLLTFTISFCVGLFVVTYLINIPMLLTGEKKIIKEYYYDKFIQNVPMDFILVLIYLLAGVFFIKLFNLKTNLYKLLAVVITTGVLTSLFCYYFLSYPLSKAFFSRWFHSVKYLSAVYDMILLGVIYSIYLYLEQKLR